MTKPLKEKKLKEWIELKEGVAKPKGQDHMLVVSQDHREDTFQAVGYWNQLTHGWVINGEIFSEYLINVTHYRELDWP